VNSSIGGTFVGYTSNPIDNTENRSIYFDNVGSYVNGPTNIPLTNNFTVSVWFKVNVYNTGSIIGKWYAASGNAHRCWIINTDTPTSKMAIVLSSDGTYSNSTIKRYLVSVNLNEYTQLTFSFASGTLLIYKNGILADVTKSIDGSFTSVYDNVTRAIQLGYFFDFSNYYNLANIGITKIYNRVLTADEILQNYNATKKKYNPEENIVTNGLVLNIDPSKNTSYPGIGNTIYDLSGSGNTGTLSNSPTFLSINGGSLIYDGTNDYTTIPHNSSQNLTYITVSAWFNFPTVPFSGLGINKEGSFRLMSAEAYTSTASGRLGGSWGTGVGPGSTTLKPNKWYQIVMTADGTTQKLYVNGTLDYSANNSALASVNSNVLSFATYHFGASNFMNCQISQTQVYNRALSATEILQNYNATKNRFVNVLPPVRNGLVLELDAGQRSSYPGTGNTWYDVSGNSLNGTLTNGPAFSGIGATSSIVFDRSNDYVNVGDSSLLSTFTGMTLEIIVKYTSTNDQIFVQKWNYALGNDGYTLELLSSAIVGACYSGGGTYLFTSVSNYPINNIYHIVFTLNGSTQTMYINGVLVATNSSGSVPITAGKNLMIGQRSSAGTYFGGNNYLTKFYNRGLSAYEVKQNFDYYRTRYNI
jgi:hypothetical protein